MDKLKNPDFFKEKTFEGPKNEEKKDEEPARVRQESPVHAMKPEPHVRPDLNVDLGKPLSVLISQASAELSAQGQKRLAAAVESARRDAARTCFTVAVVGEFSSGKSTLVNRLLDRELLPTGMLPTTALLTRIRFAATESMEVFDTAGNRKSILPADSESWEGLTAENFGGDDPVGTVMIGLKSPWLGKSRLEIIDTPGIGDLEERRARVVADALTASDAVIIATSATQPLSLTEKMFIEQRLLAQKTPFLMLAVTKLDEVPMGERAKVIDFIRKKLEIWRQEDPKRWRAKIPVILPYEMETTDDTLKSVMGLDTFRKILTALVTDPRRVNNTRSWIASKAAGYVELGIAALEEKRVLLAADEDKRKELIASKEAKLSDAAIVWENIRLEMLKRCNACWEMFSGRAKEYAGAIVERLQYEVSHTPSPKKWWEEDYPYRLKVELANMATGLENMTSKRIAEDARWFNGAMEQSFKSHVLVGQETIVEKPGTPDTGSAPEMDDIDRQRVVAKVGTTVLTIAGYAICASMGALPILATMGIGTGASVISDKFFRSKIEKQREVVRDALAKNVPGIIDDSAAESEQRIRAVYDDMINAARSQENTWMQTQKEIIAESVNAAAKAADGELESRIAKLRDIKNELEAI